MANPEPAPVPGKESVTRSLMRRLEEREKKGVETYGRSLETWNGRNCVRDALEEVLDAAQYLHQWEKEREDLLAENERLRADLALSRWKAENLEGESKALNWENDSLSAEVYRLRKGLVEIRDETGRGTACAELAARVLKEADDGRTGRAQGPGAGPGEDHEGPRDGDRGSAV